MDASGAEAKNIVLNLHLRWGRAWGYQLRQISVDGGGRKKRLLAHADAVRLRKGASPIGFGGPLPFRPLVRRSRRILCLWAIRVQRAMDMYSKYSLLVRVYSNNPLDRGLPDRVSPFLGDRILFGWIRAGNGRLIFGPVSARSATVACRCGGRALGVFGRGAVFVLQNHGPSKYATSCTRSWPVNSFAS